MHKYRYKISIAFVIRLTDYLFSSSSNSGAIQPSVPVIPLRLENDWLPISNLVHNPKSEIIASISPLCSETKEAHCVA